MLSLIVDEVDLKNRTNQWLDHIINFNKEHFIQSYNVTESNLPEEEHYISGMIPTGFINGQYESIFYVNSSFQVNFSIYFSDS